MTSIDELTSVCRVGGVVDVTSDVALLCGGTDIVDELRQRCLADGT